MRWGSTEAHADRGPEAAGSATVFDASDLASSMLDYDEVLAMLDKDDELDAAEAALAAQAAHSASPEHNGSPTHHADAATPPPAAPAAVQPRQGGSPEPQPHAPPWRAVEATIEIEGTPQRRIPCPVLYRPLKQRATVNATRPSAPRQRSEL